MSEHNRMYIPSESGGQMVIAAVSTSPAALFALVQENDVAFYASIVLPICFFIVGQAINAILRLYLSKRGKDD